MNTKRQTIWLVSMLSLMVVLSAYYLFTEDTPKAPEMAAEQQHLKGDATEATQLPQVEVTEVSVGEDAQAKAAENGMAARSKEPILRSTSRADSQNRVWRRQMRLRRTKSRRCWIKSWPKAS